MRRAPGSASHAWFSIRWRKRAHGGGVAFYPGELGPGADARQHPPCRTRHAAAQGAGLPRLCGAAIACGDGLCEAELAEPSEEFGAERWLKKKHAVLPT